MPINRFVRIRLVFLLGVTLVVGIAAAALGHYMTVDDVSLESQRGTVTYVNQDADAIAFLPDGGRRNEAIGYRIGSVDWADRQGGWHSGLRPECLVPLSGGGRIELAVIHVRQTDRTPGGPIVAWIRCL
jgi:hypothetical protein